MKSTGGNWSYNEKDGTIIVDGNTDKAVANVFATDIQDESETDANAKLIVSAVNACIKLNPDNPQAVAEGISALPESLEYIIRELDKAGIIKEDSVFMLMPNKALAQVRRKE